MLNKNKIIRDFFLFVSFWSKKINFNEKIIILKKSLCLVPPCQNLIYHGRYRDEIKGITAKYLGLGQLEISVDFHREDSFHFLLQTVDRLKTGNH